MKMDFNNPQEILTNHFGFVWYLGFFIMFGALFLPLLVWPSSVFLNLDLPINDLRVVLTALIGSLIFATGVVTESLRWMDAEPELRKKVKEK